MKLILTQGDSRFAYALPEKRAGRFWVGISPLGKEDEGLLYVEGIQDRWILKSNRQAHLLDDSGRDIKEQVVAERGLYKILHVASGETASLYAEPETSDRRVFSKYHFPQKGSFVIGGSPSVDLCFENEFMLSKHFELCCDENGQIVLEPTISDNVYLNGQMLCKDQRLNPGDILSVLDLNIVIGAGIFAVNNPDGKVRLSGDIKPVCAPEIALREDEEIVESPPGVLFARSPRFKRQINVPQITIESPPAEEKPNETPLIMTVGPSITMGLASGVMAMSAMGGLLAGNTTFGQAAPMMIMSLVMMFGMITWPILGRRFEAKRKARKEVERRKRYGDYIRKFDAYIEQEKRKQSDILHENYVEVSECMERIRNRERSLWERAQSHDDFLQARLGLGDRPFQAEFEVPKQTFAIDDDAMRDRLLELTGKPRILHDVPVVLSLLEQFSVGVIGEREQTTSFMKSLIFQLAALHSYDEVKFVFIYGKDEEKEWGFTRWLPHVWSGDKQSRFMAQTPAEARRLSSFLDQEAIQKNQDEKEGPHYIVFALDRKLSEKCDALSRIVKSKEYQNVSVVTVYDELGHLPKDCSVVIEVDGDRSRLYDRTNITDAYTGFCPDSDLAFDADELAVQLANIRLETAESAFELPQMLAFLEMLNAGKVEHLNARTRWKENNPVRSLQAPVGVGAGGETFILDLHEKVHGPHGLVAGMTGSGKSEFIMTLILSLAINYHPHEVAFVLIDYKGGGMANAFTDLPHTVGVITNLEGAAVNRSLVSIQSELRRRQAIFNEATKETQVSNIDIYKYQSLYRDGRVTEPLPHLLIISDEFAELKAQQPEFMDQLVSAARIGRSLGIHLILATQKPTGVVDDQIWSNSKFKVCLKVQDKMDSMEMIKRSDAASLVDVGRFYLQVGYDELFEMGQSAWAGAPYHPAERVEKEYDASVALLDLQGNVVSQVSPVSESRSNKDAAKQLDEVTSYICGIADEEGIIQIPLWLPPLEKRIYFAGLFEKYGQNTEEPYVLESLMGEYDDPANQAQGPMSLSLTDKGNLLLYGTTGSGKTHFVASFMYAIINDHAAHEVNFYVLDFGAETLTSFAPAPHVGDVLISTDTEKTENLFAMLSKELIERRKLFVEYGGDYQGYASQVENPRPAIVVVINNLSGFKETYEEGEEWISTLTREGVRYGICFIITAQAPNTIRYTLQQNFAQHIAFSLADPSDYMAVFGRLEGLSPEQAPGRGLFRNDAGVFEFQATLISEELADSPQATRQFCQEMAKDATGRDTFAPAVPCLPEKVTPEFLYSSGISFEKGCLPIAVEKESLKVVSWSFAGPQATLVMSRSDEHQIFATLVSGMATEQGLSVLVVDEHTIPDTQTMLSATSQDLIVIQDFASLYDSLDYDKRAEFSEWLVKVSKDPTLGVAVTSSTNDLGSVAYEDWLSDVAMLNRGIWLGEGISDQYHFKADNVPFNLKVDQGFGFTLENGQLTFAKFLERDE